MYLQVSEKVVYGLTYVALYIIYILLYTGMGKKKNDITLKIKNTKVNQNKILWNFSLVKKLIITAKKEIIKGPINEPYINNHITIVKK